jgi:hypothetical protein
VFLSVDLLLGQPQGQSPFAGGSLLRLTRFGFWLFGLGAGSCRGIVGGRR